MDVIAGLAATERNRPTSAGKLAKAVAVLNNSNHESVGLTLTHAGVVVAVAGTLMLVISCCTNSVVAPRFRKMTDENHTPHSDPGQKTAQQGQEQAHRQTRWSHPIGLDRQAMNSGQEQNHQTAHPKHLPGNKCAGFRPAFWRQPILPMRNVYPSSGHESGRER